MQRNTVEVPPPGATETPGTDGLVLSGITKTFPGVVALNDVSLECRPGEVHALVGENGSGKSTLIKVAAGVIQPDSGSVQIGGAALSHADPRKARALGLMTAFQDTALVGDLTVAENIELSYHTDGIEAPQDLSGFLKRFDLPFGPNDRVSSLGPGGRQMLEVARALDRSPRVVLLDEPTAALDEGGAEQLYELILRARNEGMAILYVSHRLQEVRRLADRLTVLRDGMNQGSHSGMDWEVAEIVELMVGAPVDLEFPQRPPAAPSDALLDVADVAGEGVGPVSMTVHPGEIVGIAGAEGNGQRQLLRAIVGVGRKAGTVRVDGKAVSAASPVAALNAGINFQSGDREAEAIFPTMSVGDNSAIQLGSELGPLGLISNRRKISLFRSVAERLGIVASSPYQPINGLSGGNQQKVVLSRPSMRSPKVLIVDEPTQGVDAKARLDIYRLLSRAAENGVGVLVKSSDSLELAGLCDRVYVMSDGVVIDEVEGTFDEADIVHRFVSKSGKRDQEEAKARGETHRVAKLLASPGVPAVVLLVLIVLLGIYTASRASGFLSSNNLNNIIIAALPLICAALGQQLALLAGEFDISLGATMTIAVIIASFVLSTYSVGSLLLCVVLILAAAGVIGLLNAFITRVLKVNPIVGTIGTLSMLSGVAIVIRPKPAGAIDPQLGIELTRAIGWLPYAFIVLAILAFVLDFWLYRTGSGLAARAVGLKTESAQRLGVHVNRLKTAGYLAAAVGAGIGGLFLATQIGIGSNDAGLSFALPTFASCFLGGAALGGGRGTFVGALLGALFLSVLTNTTQLLSISTAWGSIFQGVILIVAVATYAIADRKSGR